MSDQPDWTPIEETPRFLQVLRVVARHGGRYQVRLPDFAAEAGVSENTLRTAIRRAKALKVLEVRASGHPVMGTGRFPNEYRLLMTVDDWVRNKETILEREELARAVKRVAARQTRARGRARDERQAQARRRVVAARAAGNVDAALPVEPIRVPVRPVGPIDVDAWADATDF